MTNNTQKKLRPKEREAIIQSLRAGVTPRAGLQHIQVGRVKEVEALLKDIQRISEGGSAFRIIIGDFGSGKSFFLQLIRSIALEMGLVTVHGDLSPDRRLHATGGQARNLYAELMRNLSTRTKPEGNALASVVERFITEARRQADHAGVSVHEVISERLNHLTEMVGGYDFAKVISAYWQGYEKDQEELKLDAVRWLRGEFSTKTEARTALGVRTIVDDANIYDHFKLMSYFVRQAGYKGFLVNLDEMVNLYKLSSQKARVSNYEQILRI
ncbi:MAG: ATP-binding protein, partial [Deltaproteobacteria bacterium]|nr:ATP-binding protein [Deltaproteobacteria bacterium]